MGRAFYAVLAERGILRLSGAEAKNFLQGLVSNDVNRVAPDRAIYAALLTPQGKFLHDFFICEQAGDLLLDCEEARAQDLLRRLSLYKLRAKVTIADETPRFRAVTFFGAEDFGALSEVSLGPEAGSAAPFASGLIYRDPRLPALGLRALLPAESAAATLEKSGLEARTAEDYDRHRLKLGVPDGSRDLEVERALLLESNFEALHGVDFAKGCYMGQELTARTKYRGLVRKRLYRVDVTGPLPAPGTIIRQGEKEAGIMRSGRGETGLALLRLEALEGTEGEGLPLTAGEARLTPVATAASAPAED